MTLGKFINEEMHLVETEDAKQIERLTIEGYEPVCLTDKPCEDAIARYEHIEGGWIQIWDIPQPDPSM